MRPGIVGCSVRPRSGVPVCGTVTAVFEKAVHLRTEEAYITLGTPDLPSHPFTIATPRYPGNLNIGLGFTLNRLDLRFSHGSVIPFAGMKTYTPVRSHSGRGTIKEIEKAVAGTREWAKRQPFVGGFHEMLGAEPPVENSWNRLLAATGRNAINRVIYAMRAGSWSRLADGVEQLAGLGHGLTPSGDDWLAGFLATLRSHGDGDGAVPSAERLADLAQRAGTRTSPFSAFLIRCSVHGLISEPVARWITSARNGSLEETVRAAKDVASMGHSSGMDCLAGLVAGLEATLE
jgi:hypothetical protein